MFPAIAHKFTFRCRYAGFVARYHLRMLRRFLPGEVAGLGDEIPGEVRAVSPPWTYRSRKRSGSSTRYSARSPSGAPAMFDEKLIPTSTVDCTFGGSCPQ